MATDPTRILVPGMARLWLGVVGSTFPSKSDDVLDTAWVEAGLFTEDSLKFESQPKFNDVTSHQSAYPTRKIQTEDAATLTVDLQEWSLENFQAVFGGGTVTVITGTPTQYKFSPPVIGGRTEIAAIAELNDGAKKYRLCIPRAMQDANATLELKRTQESTLPLGLSVLGGGVGDPWFLLTNDPAFAAA
jgi:hypothetical protein